ncbi:MAG: FAD-dependent 5-carboxymethylaminomethyl-2-thiouridine(34) oxidoreductase MnmC [Pseudomonadota bacterium]
MTRLPLPPRLTWRSDGAPFATAHDDIYFAAGDGLGEARTVFLQGNHLPERWKPGGRFVVAETGFGTGLNFLACWALWKEHGPVDGAWLHFISFEGFPMERGDAARALGVWPEISALSERLIGRWPTRARGVQHMTWPDDRIALTLHIDDIADALPKAQFRADAWFLDGFSPARNGEMWSDWLYPAIAERSSPGATAATFTVAGQVRRGLAAAGFSVEKVSGFGRKRERLEARLAPARVQPTIKVASETPARSVAIMGAGIMGACLAHTLANRGVSVTVFDRADKPASGASGNPLALVMPRLDAADTVQARLLIDSYLAARTTYSAFPACHPADVAQSARNEADLKRFMAVLADPPLPLEDLEALRDGGLLHKRALIINPRELVTALLGATSTEFGKVPSVDLKTRTVNGGRYDAIVLANGMAVDPVAPWLGLVAKLGQVDFVADASDAPASAMASGPYALCQGKVRLWGATYETVDGHTAATTSRAASIENGAHLETLAPWWRPQVRDAGARARAAIRATTPDRLPAAGPLPAVEAAVEALAPLGKGRAVGSNIPMVDGVWIATGLGSRGFTFAPWLAQLITAQITGDPLPTTRDAEAAVSPLRFLERRIKRGIAVPLATLGSI